MEQYLCFHSKVGKFLCKRSSGPGVCFLQWNLQWLLAFRFSFAALAMSFAAAAHLSSPGSYMRALGVHKCGWFSFFFRPLVLY